uniref:7TM GPCR serpentine receptor class x (Srx) domain-containing protein n=1 Tax=Romanomermis culicivorax TaxID=13658 RepID=A0A915ITR1_ROMCU
MTDQGLRHQQYYRIVANMGITDILQLTFNGMFAGIFTYACVDFAKSDLKMYINKFVGGLMNFNWVIYCFFAHLLAFNRFCHIFFPNHINFIFSRQNTNLMLLMVWVYGFGWFVAYMVPNFNLFYYVEEYKWDYDIIPLSRKAWLSELISDSIHATGMVIWYTCILVKLRIKVTILRCAGNNAIIYIMLNSTINRKFRKLVFHGKNVFVSRIVPTRVSMVVQHCSTISTKNKETLEKRERLAIHLMMEQHIENK